jgi:hypothetical protein
MIDASGPVTSGPVPTDHATSEARSVSPPLRRLPPRTGSVVRAISATVMRLRGDTSIRRPTGRAMSSPWMTASTSEYVNCPGKWLVRPDVAR